MAFHQQGVAVSAGVPALKRPINLFEHPGVQNIFFTDIVLLATVASPANDPNDTERAVTTTRASAAANFKASSSPDPDFPHSGCGFGSESMQEYPEKL